MLCWGWGFDNKEYKKASEKEFNETENNQKQIVSELELEDRVYATMDQRCLEKKIIYQATEE